MLWYCFRLKFIDLCSNKLTGLPSPPSWKSIMLKEVLVSRNQINKVIRTLLSNDFHGIFIESKLACTLIWFLSNASIHIKLYDNMWQILSLLTYFCHCTFFLLLDKSWGRKKLEQVRVPSSVQQWADRGMFIFLEAMFVQRKFTLFSTLTVITDILPVIT